MQDKPKLWPCHALQDGTFSHYLLGPTVVRQKIKEVVIFAFDRTGGKEVVGMEGGTTINWRSTNFTQLCFDSAVGLLHVSFYATEMGNKKIRSNKSALSMAWTQNNAR
jgi:hypothetical protein